MGDTYTRQSSYTDGDVITAAHTNNEFNQLLAAFAANTGHTHDGTTGEGGPITKLASNTLTLGAGTVNSDVIVTFDGEERDGILRWIGHDNSGAEDDHFRFDDDVMVNLAEKLYFRDTAIYINSSTDGQLDLIADGTVLIDTAGDITLDADGGDVFFKDGGTTYGSLTNTSGNLIIKSGTTTAVTFSGANTTFAGTVTIGSAEISEAELEILDGATVTTDELNILDGDTSATSTTVADADRVVFNDAGTMKQVAVTDLAAYFDDEITAMPNLVTVGALDSGSITSGFGNINTGSSTITTTGLITGGSLDIDDVVINGSTIGHTDDTDLITVANGIVTVAGEISVTTLDIGGTNVTATATELNLLDGVSGLVQADFTKLAAVDATATELNIMDGDTSASSTTLADADRVVVNDAGTMKQVALTDFETYFESALDTLSNVTTVGALNSGSITSGFGNIDVGSSNLTATGTISLGATSFNDNAITNVGDIALDSISADGTDINVAVSDNSATAFTIKQGSDNYLVIDTANSSESVAIGTGISGTAISIGHSTSETTVNDNLTITGNLTVSGTTTTVNTTNTTVSDNLLELNSGASSNSNDVGIIVQRGSTGNDALFMWDESEDKFALGTTTDNASSTGNLNMTTGTLVANIEGAVTGNVTGNVSGTAATVTGAAQSNITSLGTLTTLTVDNVIVNGTTIGHTDDTDLITLADGVVTVAGEVSMTTLDIGGTNVGSTAAELNLLDGSAKSTSSITIADADAFIVIDGTTTKQIPASDLKTYASGASASKGFATAMAIAL